MIKVTNEIQRYEVEDSDGTLRDASFEERTDRPVIITSHWNQSEMVVLEVPIGKAKTTTKFTVLAKDLQAAIENATNTRRF